MTAPVPIYAYVLACLSAKVIPQRQVAEGAGVPYSTVAKIAQGVISDPSVHTVQKLYDYFLKVSAQGHQVDGLACSDNRLP